MAMKSTRYVLAACLVVLLSAACGLSGSQASPSSNASPSASVSPEAPTAEPSRAPLTTAAPITSPAATDGFLDPDRATELLSKCAVVGEVAYYFVIPPGSDFHTIFPKAGLAPELDGIDGLFVVTYAGDVQILNLSGGGTMLPGGPTRPTTFSDVVCVVSPDGTADVYEDVSHEDMALPPGAHSGPPAQGT